MLIILRVADKSAVTSGTVVSGRISGFKARSRGELTSGSGDLPGGDPANSSDEGVTNTYELRVGVQTTGAN